MKVRIAGSCPVNLLLQWDKKIISGSHLSLKNDHAPEKFKFLPCQNVTYTHTVIKPLFVCYITQSLKPQGWKGFCYVRETLKI